MIKKTLYFGNPAHLFLKNGQLFIKLPLESNIEDGPSKRRELNTISRPIEDIGVVIIDSPQITLTSKVIDALLNNNVALITCDDINYGYAILRAITARSLVGSGLLPTFGIHHHNRYNAYCLADDIMEPYRPYVDEIVCNLREECDDLSQIYELDTSLKKKMLEIAGIEVKIDGRRSPLMIAMQQTTSSLAKCFSGESRKISYPTITN